jgi:hypothetical protein
MDFRGKHLWWHGTRAADAILAHGVDFAAGRASDPGDLGWGFYLSGSRARARCYGRQLLRVTIRPARFAYLPNPYFLDGMNSVAPTTDVERLFYAHAFESDDMKTCSARHDNEAAAKAVRDAFVAAGYAGIITPYEGGEAVVFTPDGIAKIERVE